MNQTKHIYFLGIGGIGMSALAFYYMDLGHQVYGYDLTPSPITDKLLSKGAIIHFEENISLIPKHIDFVIHTPAVEINHAEYQYFINNHIPIFKRSEILGEFSSATPTIAVAGTHGKTTTTALITHLLYPEHQVTAFIGGIAKNGETNYISSLNAETLIVEADEYDRSFLTLYPSVAVITSMDADHLDVYEKKEKMQETFRLFADKILMGGSLVIHENISEEIMHSAKTVYGFSDSANCFADNINIRPDHITFDLHYYNHYFPQLTLGISGKYNLLNALGAIAAVFSKYPNNDTTWRLSILKKLSTFKGVKRRFDYQIYTEKLIYIDDYAHHPQEIASFLKSVKDIFPEKKITLIFQPHLYSRTRDFAHEFALSLALADKVILLDIYPAREKPIQGVDSAWLLSLIDKQEKWLLNKESLFAFLQKERPEVLITLGAGDIDRIVPFIKNELLP